MAKWFLHFLLLSTILFGCKEEKKEPVSIDYAEFSTKEVLLVGIIRDFDNPDTIGKVSIKIPAGWIHFINGIEVAIAPLVEDYNTDSQIIDISNLQKAAFFGLMYLIQYISLLYLMFL
jgi:hypothetical protein